MFTQVRKQNVSICLQERGPNSPGSLLDAITPLMPLQCHHNLYHMSTEASQSSGCLCSDLGKVREHRSHWRAEHDTRVTATVTAGRKAGAEHRTWPQLGQTAGTFLPPARTQGCSGMLNTKAGKESPRPPHLWGKHSLWALLIQHKLAWHYLLFPCNLVH